MTQISSARKNWLLDSVRFGLTYNIKCISLVHSDMINILYFTARNNTLKFIQLGLTQIGSIPIN